MEAIILAGGLGTRLQSVVADRPKALSDVAGRPFLAYLMEYLRSEGVTRLVFSVGYKADQIEAFLASDHVGIDYVVSRESEPLGTGGAIRLALQQVQGEDVLIVNGDTFFEVPLKAFYKAHIQQQADCSIALKRLHRFSRYGAVTLGEDMRVLGFEEKKYKEEGYINGGFIWLNKGRCGKMLDTMPDVFSFEVDFLQPQLEQIRVFGFPCDGYFIDIGIPSDYELSQQELPRRVWPVEKGR